MNLIDWAIKWDVSLDAIADLRKSMIHGPTGAGTMVTGDAVSETGVTKREQLAAAATGGILWRNNVGSTQTECHAPKCKGNIACVRCGQSPDRVRWGLANVSKQMNASVKSSDLIGIKPVIVTGSMTGMVIGQFTARECKRPGWRWTGTEREVAQQRYLEIVTAMGGDAAFTSGE